MGHLPEGWRREVKKKTPICKIIPGSGTSRVKTIHGNSHPPWRAAQKAGEEPLQAWSNSKLNPQAGKSQALRKQLAWPPSVLRAALWEPPEVSLGSYTLPFPSLLSKKAQAE